ncbi:MAG: hypothetical protein ACM3KL_05665 [Alphaproteobacteria bacterium]
MRANVTFGPVTLPVCFVETTRNNELAYVIMAIAGNAVIGEHQHQIHPMFARAAAVIVKTSPGPGREIHF